jgi:uncharacterized protein (DUF2249 family)
MPSTTSIPAQVVDLREGDGDQRLPTALAAYRRLGVGAAMELIDGRDPTDLYSSLQSIAPGDFEWLYQRRGPQAWHVSVRKLSRLYSAGDCCGMCLDRQIPVQANPFRSIP